jgi:hypothetical protein
MIASVFPCSQPVKTADAAAPLAGAQAVRNVLLAHGAFVDGSAWRGVHDG